MIISITKGFSTIVLLYSLIHSHFQDCCISKLTFVIMLSIFMSWCLALFSFSLFNSFYISDMHSRSHLSVNIIQEVYGLQYRNIDSTIQNTHLYFSNNQSTGNDNIMINDEIPSVLLPSSVTDTTPSDSSYYSSSSMIVDGDNSFIVQNDSNYKNNYLHQINNQTDNICSGSIKIGSITTAPISQQSIGANQYIPISGNDQDNYIIGIQGNALVCAKGGNDIVMGLPGNNIIYGGKGDDTLYGAPGLNQLFGEDGSDNLVGSQFNDLLVGGNGNDHLAAGSGDDVLYGGPGSNYFDCGDGIDTVVDYNPSQGDVITNNCEIVNNLGH